MTERNLSQVEVGEHVEIAGYSEITEDNKVYVSKLATLGFTKGITVEVVAIAPLGDPVKVRLRDSYFALRKSEMQCVLVK